jgi:hypothetical protein
MVTRNVHVRYPPVKTGMPVTNKYVCYVPAIKQPITPCNPTLHDQECVPLLLNLAVTHIQLQPTPSLLPFMSCRTVKQLSHDGFSSRCEEIGWGGCAENVLYNYEDSVDAASTSMTQWYNSEGHRNNLMNPVYTKVGFGYVKCTSDDGRIYWTALYGN